MLYRMRSRNFATPARQQQTASPDLRPLIVERIRPQENRTKRDPAGMRIHERRVPVLGIGRCRPATIQFPVTTLQLRTESRQPPGHHPIPMVQGQLGESDIDLYYWTG